MNDMDLLLQPGRVRASEVLPRWDANGDDVSAHHLAGKHRRPSRLNRVSSRLAGIAALTATGVAGSVAAVALAAEPAAVREVGLIPAARHGGSMPDRIAAQAEAQRSAAEKRSFEDAARSLTAEKVKKQRLAEVRAAREAERERLLAYVAPLSDPQVSTFYKARGSLWSSGSHTGLDFYASIGTPVRVVGAGKVVQARWGGAYGNEVVVRMADGTYTQYGHLSHISASVGEGVSAGQRIGFSGDTGNATGPHLHFEARTGAEYGTDIDPIDYLRSHGVRL